MSGKTIVNEPLAKTFGWLRVNGTPIDAPQGRRETTLSLRAGEERTVITEDAPGAAAINVTLDGGAVLRLIQLRRDNDGRTVNDVKVKCAEGSRFEWYRLVLSGGEIYDNCSVILEGEGAEFGANIGYSIALGDKLDINCEAIHLGKKTNSEIYASGVLFKGADKLLRGTIDLRHGCKGAVGNEMEDVLLMDEDVRNRSVPVILCSEEDVVGNHGATIGELDESLVYYLESRGMEKESIYDMMSKARVDAVIRRLPDAALRDELLGTEAE